MSIISGSYEVHGKVWLYYGHNGPCGKQSYLENAEPISRKQGEDDATYFLRGLRTNSIRNFSKVLDELPHFNLNAYVDSGQHTPFTPISHAVSDRLACSVYVLVSRGAKRERLHSTLYGSLISGGGEEHSKTRQTIYALCYDAPVAFIKKLWSVCRTEAQLLKAHEPFMINTGTEEYYAIMIGRYIEMQQKRVMCVMMSHRRGVFPGVPKGVMRIICAYVKSRQDMPKPTDTFEKEQQQHNKETKTHVLPSIVPSMNHWKIN